MNTAAKRASAINVGSPWRGVLAYPDGTVDQGDRQAAAFMYSGVLSGSSEYPRTCFTLNFLTKTTYGLDFLTKTIYTPDYITKTVDELDFGCD